MPFKAKRGVKPAAVSLYDWETRALAKWVQERGKLKADLLRRFPALRPLLCSRR